MKIKDVVGKTVYVVGGSSGIGLAVSKLFAAKGANVLLLSRSPERLKIAAAEVRDVISSESQKIETRRRGAKVEPGDRLQQLLIQFELGRMLSRIGFGEWLMDPDGTH